MLANAVYFGWKFLDGQSSRAIQQIVGEPISVEGGQIVMLSERPAPGQSNKAIVEPEDGANVAPTVALRATPHCYLIGPFFADAAMSDFGARMKSRGAMVRTESRKVEEEDFWVFIPPFTSREKAEERLRELQSRGVEGFVVKNGVFANSISLNHFSKKELAMSFRQKMKLAGISVEYREIKRPGVQYWLYLALPEINGPLQADMDKYLENNDGLRREIAACEK
jgi:hypothetical protein